MSSWGVCRSSRSQQSPILLQLAEDDERKQGARLINPGHWIDELLGEMEIHENVDICSKSLADKWRASP